MKALFTITAVFEAVTGIALAIAPSRLVLALLGSTPDSPQGIIIARVLAAALFSLGAACWFARAEPPGQAVTGLIAAMLVYNVSVISLFCYARFGQAISGPGLLPAVVAHSALAVWCVVCLGRQTSRGKN
jgi:protein-S-isoprenylcysteine O-methyltransferase Ste14